MAGEVGLVGGVCSKSSSTDAVQSTGKSVLVVVVQRESVSRLGSQLNCEK